MKKTKKTTYGNNMTIKKWKNGENNMEHQHHFLHQFFHHLNHYLLLVQHNTLRCICDHCFTILVPCVVNKQMRIIITIIKSHLDKNRPNVYDDMLLANIVSCAWMKIIMQHLNEHSQQMLFQLQHDDWQRMENAEKRRFGAFTFEM